MLLLDMSQIVNPKINAERDRLETSFKNLACRNLQSKQLNYLFCLNKNKFHQKRKKIKWKKISKEKSRDVDDRRSRSINK